MVSGEPREGTVHSSSLQDAVSDCPTCQPERLGGTFALKIKQLVYLFWRSWFHLSLASPTAVRGRLPVPHLGRAAAFPTHPGAQSSDVRTAAAPLEVVASSASLLEGLEPGNGVLPPDRTTALFCWYFLR